MTEQDTHHHPAGVKEEESQSTNMDHVSASNEDKKEELDNAQNVMQQHAGDGDSAEEEIGGSPSPDESSTQTVEDNSTPPQADDGGHGDVNRKTHRDEEPTMIGKETSRVKEEEIQSTNMDHFSASNEDKQEELDNAQNVLEENSGDGDSAEEEIDGSPSPDESSTQTVEDNSTPPQADDGGHGDVNRKTHRDEEPTMIGKETSTSPATLSDKMDDQVDGSKARRRETTDTDTEAGEGPSTTEGARMDKQEKDILTIGPLDQKNTEPAVPVVTEGSRSFLIAVSVVLVVAVAALVQLLLQPESPPQKDDVRQIGIFLRQMDKLKAQFPKQRSELWNRSKIHLLRHLQTAQPTEPVSLMLTAGVRAEKTMHCLAQGLASSFSSALNASVLHIDGASKASQDSDQVKLDIDSKLQGAFEGDKPVAVIHRFEELPPGSTLIFYRYCDHENAAFKKTFLIFTVLLGEEEEIPAESRLSTVEEMVDDHLQKKFLSDGHPASFDRMDLDKYGGLWSRISHLILPVAAEERVEHKGC